jgi:nicotinamidase/pyrazinamidase
VAGSEGANFHPKLRTELARLVLRKGANRDLDSYSAFFENDGITPTGLAGWIQEQGIQSIVVVGLATDYCVKATALDGRKLGLDVAVVKEGIRGVDAYPGDAEKAVDAMRSAGCHMLALKEIIR